jgi:hypothetical protein
MFPAKPGLRERLARLATEWEADRDYSQAIKMAERGDRTRLVNRLRAKLPLTDGDFDALARLNERDGKRGRRGRPKNEPLRECARLGKELLSHPLLVKASPFEISEYACRSYERDMGVTLDPEQVLRQMNRPASRRH